MSRQTIRHCFIRAIGSNLPLRAPESNLYEFLGEISIQVFIIEGCQNRRLSMCLGGREGSIRSGEGSFFLEAGQRMYYYCCVQDVIASVQPLGAASADYNSQKALQPSLVANPISWVREGVCIWTKFSPITAGRGRCAAGSFWK